MCTGSRASHAFSRAVHTARRDTSTAVTSAPPPGRQQGQRTAPGAHVQHPGAGRRGHLVEGLGQQLRVVLRGVHTR